MPHPLITIRDAGQPEYLDGAMMQYEVNIGKYLNGETVAYCSTIEVARLLAYALAGDNGNIIISTGNDYMRD